MPSSRKGGKTRRWLLKRMMSGATFAATLSARPAAAEKGPPSFQGDVRTYTQVIPAYPAPLTPFYTPNGGVTNLRHYRGNVVLLNMWATWCPTCLHELPTLSALQSELEREKFKVVTLDVGEDNPDLAARYFQRLGIHNLPLLYDPADRAPTAFGTRHGLPWNFVIDRQGLVRGYLMGGANWRADDAKRLITYYIG